MKWYKANTGNDQGLVTDEETGANIAVTYDKKHAELVAAAPEMLEVCRQLTSYNVSYWMENAGMLNALQIKAFSIISEVEYEEV